MNKQHENYIIYTLIIVVVAILAYSMAGFFRADAQENEILEEPDLSRIQKNSVQEDPDFLTISTGTTGPGDVSVELLPHAVEDGLLNVDIWVNTHSVDLSKFDLREITTLSYNGKTAAPVSAPPLGGHHVSGTMTFDVGEELSTFTIIIKGIPNVEERMFEWQ